MKDIYPITTHIEDTDFTGIVYHVNYLKFIERARSTWLRRAGFGVEWQNKHQITFVVHSMQIKYLKPSRVHQDLEVVSSVKKINAASLVLEQYLRETNNDSNIICRAEIKIACVSPDGLRPSALPEINQIRSKLS